MTDSDSDSDTDSGSDRVQRLKDGVGTLKVPGATGDRDNQLLKAGIVAIAVGIVFVVLGWFGASGTLDLSEHVPYLISGGVLGLCLVVAGTGLVVRSSMARLLKLSLARLLHEQQAQTDRSVDVLERLEALLGGSATSQPPMMGAPSTVEGNPSPTHGHDDGPGHDDQLRAIETDEPAQDEGGAGHEHSHAHVHEHGDHVVHAHDHDHDHAHGHDAAAHADASDDHPHAHGADDHDHDHPEADGPAARADAWSSDQEVTAGSVASTDPWNPAAGDDGATPASWPSGSTEEPDLESEPDSGGSKKRRQPIRARKPSR